MLRSLHPHPALRSLEAKLFPGYSCQDAIDRRNRRGCINDPETGALVGVYFHGGGGVPASLFPFLDRGNYKLAGEAKKGSLAQARLRFAHPAVQVQAATAQVQRQKWKLLMSRFRRRFTCSQRFSCSECEITLVGPGNSGS